MAPRTRRRDPASAARLRALTRRAYLATAGHLEVEEEPDALAREERGREFDEIVRGPGDVAAPDTDAPPGADSRTADAGTRPRETVRWRVSVKAVTAVILVLAALTGIVVARSLVTAGRAATTVPLPGTEVSGLPGPGASAGSSGEDGAATAPVNGDAGPDAPTGGGGVPRDAGPGSVPSPADVADGARAPEPLVVHVAGAVARPGVVTVPTGARVADVVESAGGALAGAELGAINLARLVADGEQVFVPEIGEATPGAEAGSAGGSSGAGAAGTDSEPVVDLNTADQAGLEALPGVGPAIAQRIVEWRSTNGSFHSVDELQEVSGIGPATMERLRPRVTV